MLTAEQRLADILELEQDIRSCIARLNSLINSNNPNIEMLRILAEDGLSSARSKVAVAAKYYKDI